MTHVAVAIHGDDGDVGDRDFDGPVFVDVARSELAKLFTVRATYLSLAAAVFLIIAAAIGLCEAYVRHVAQLSLTQLEFNPTSYSLSGVLVAQLVIGVLGILVITSEHATGLIRSTFAAVPQRRTVLAAKATVFGLVTLIVSEAAAFTAFGIGQAILAGNHTGTTLAAPGVLRAVAGSGLYLALLGLLALAIGVIVRHSAGAVAVLFAILLVLPAMTEGLPDSLQETVNPYLPAYAGQAMFRTSESGHLLQPWQGLALFTAYTAAALVVAAITIGHRDT